MVNRERDDNVYYARLAEQGERYEDMIRYMKEVAAVSTPFQPPAHCPQQPHILINKQWVCPWALEAALLSLRLKAKCLIFLSTIARRRKT